MIFAPPCGIVIYSKHEELEMRLNSSMSKEDVQQALRDAVARTWGEERVDADSAIIAQAARNVWIVMQEPLTPFSEEPDLHCTTPPQIGDAL